MCAQLFPFPFWIKNGFVIVHRGLWNANVEKFLILREVCSTDGHRSRPFGPHCRTFFSVAEAETHRFVSVL